VKNKRKIESLNHLPISGVCLQEMKEIEYSLHSLLYPCRSGTTGLRRQFPLLRSESPSGMCAKLRTVVASNNTDHAPQSLYYCLFPPHIYVIVLRAHPVRGESHNQRKTTGEVATPLYMRRGIRAYFRSECCAGGESMTASSVNCSLHQLTSRAVPLFQVFGMARRRFQRSLLVLVARAQLSVAGRCGVCSQA